MAVMTTRNDSVWGKAGGWGGVGGRREEKQIACAKKKINSDPQEEDEAHLTYPFEVRALKTHKLALDVMV
jgi:hypothetical protein